MSYYIMPCWISQRYFRENRIHHRPCLISKYPYSRFTCPNQTSTHARTHAPTMHTLYLIAYRAIAGSPTTLTLSTSFAMFATMSSTKTSFHPSPLKTAPFGFYPPLSTKNPPASKSYIACPPNTHSFPTLLSSIVPSYVMHVFAPVPPHSPQNTARISSTTSPLGAQTKQCASSKT